MEFPNTMGEATHQFTPIQASPSEEKSLAKTERAARQQGSSFLRENSSNGGKTIRTFWLHTRGRERECQEQIEGEISCLYSII
jgi:hypothetical protein